MDTATGENYNNQSDDGSSNSMEYHDALQEQMDVEAEENGQKLTQSEVPHPNTNQETRHASLSSSASPPENHAEPEDHQSLINNANNTQFTGDDSFEFINIQDADGLERCNDGQSNYLSASVKHQEESRKKYVNGNENDRTEGNSKQTEFSSFGRYRDSKRESSSSSESHPETSDESDEDQEVSGNTHHPVPPEIQKQMRGLQVGSDEENTKRNVDDLGYYNERHFENCTDGNKDYLYDNEDDNQNRIQKERAYSSKHPATIHSESFSEHEESQRHLDTVNHSQNSADDLRRAIKIPQNVTGREHEYDNACHSGTLSSIITDDEAEHTDDDYTHGKELQKDFHEFPLQETDIADGEYSYEDIATGKGYNGERSNQSGLNNDKHRTEVSDDEATLENENHSHSRRNKLTYETTTLETSADEGDISEDQLTEDEEDDSDDRSNSSTGSRDDFIYTQLSWESYIKSHKDLQDWEDDDVDDDIEKAWTRSRYAGHKKEKFYRDVISYDEDEDEDEEEDDEDDVTTGGFCGWKEGEKMYIGEPSEELLEKRERILNTSGNTRSEKNLKHIATGGARPKTYKKKYEQHVRVSHKVIYEEAAGDRKSRRKHLHESVHSQKSEWYSDDDSSDHTPTGTIAPYNNNKGRFYERTGDSEYEEKYDQANHREESFNGRMSPLMTSEDDDEDQQTISSNSNNKSEVRYSEDEYDENELPGDEAGIDREADRRSPGDGVRSPHSIVEYLAQQPNFGTDAETLLGRFGSGESVIEMIESNSNIFQCTDNWVKLMPSVHVCPYYLRKEGCSDKSSCLGFHICNELLINVCEDANCIMGHSIRTSHNKKVLKSFCMESLESRLVLNILRSLFAGFDSHRAEEDSPTSYGKKQSMDSAEGLQSKKDKDRTQNKNATGKLSLIKNFFTPPEMIDTRGATGTFGTVWSHYTGGDTEIEEICSKGLQSVCEHETGGCKRLHAKLPFHWQIKTRRDVGWMNLQEHQVKHLEKSYCNPALAGTSLPPVDTNGKPNLIHVISEDEVWYADFISMKLINDSIPKPYQLRRLQLQTVGKGKKYKSHIWYFQDHEGAWVPYGETVTAGNQKTRSKVSSLDIEKQYLSGAKKMKFHSSDYALSYQIDFAKMVQINTVTNAVRDVRRRPKPIYENYEKV